MARIMKRTAVIFFAVIIAFTMAAALLGQPSHATDRTKIYNIIASSSDIDSIPVNGKPVSQKPTINISVGTMAYFMIDEMNGWWQVYEDGKWVNKYSGNFYPGQWRFCCQVRIDGTAGQDYVLADPLSVNVNSRPWTNVEPVREYPTYSFKFVASPTYTIAAPYAKSFVLGGNTMIFKQDTYISKRLPTLARPYQLSLTARTDKQMLIQWTDCKNSARTSTDIWS